MHFPQIQVRRYATRDGLAPVRPSVLSKRSVLESRQASMAIATATIAGYATCSPHAQGRRSRIPSTQSAT